MTKQQTYYEHRNYSPMNPIQLHNLEIMQRTGQFFPCFSCRVETVRAFNKIETVLLPGLPQKVSLKII